MIPLRESGTCPARCSAGRAPLPPPTATDLDLRLRWGVEGHRRIALFFGSIAARKGIFQTLDALPLLPTAEQEMLALVIAGKAVASDAGRLDQAVTQARDRTRVQVIHEPRFVDEEEIPGLFRASDLVLLPYQRHVGSSGVLIRAAQAGIPVLGSDYGLVGHHVRTSRLGLALDTTRPAAVATGLSRWLSGAPIDFDLRKAQAFGAANTVGAFCSTIFGALLGSPHEASTS